MFDPIDLSFFADAVLDEVMSGEPRIDGTILRDLPAPLTGATPANCHSKPIGPRKAAPVSWLLLMSYTSNPPVVLLRNNRSVSPGTLLKLPTPENCQSRPTLPMKAALVI